jgi:hypothetical protein
MKRLFIVLIILTSSITHLKSQNLIFSAGLNISNTNLKFYDPVIITDWYPLFSPNLMINYEYKFNRTFSFRPGISYSRQGRRTVSDLGPTAYVEYKYVIDFIDIPFLFSYNVNPRSIGGYSLNLSAGVFLGYGMRGQRIEDITAVVSKDKIFEGPDAIYRNDYGLMFVTGFGDTENQLALFFQYGLRNMATTESDFTRFNRVAAGLNYSRIINFGSNARNILKKRFF